MNKYFIIGTILFVLLWLFSGYQNYKNVRDVIIFYNGHVESLSKAEEKEEDTFYKAFLFNEREELINNNLHLEELRQSYLVEGKKFKLSLMLSFLVLGPFYRMK